jgi:hypothetical protein
MGGAHRRSYLSDGERPCYVIILPYCRQFFCWRPATPRATGRPRVRPRRFPPTTERWHSPPTCRPPVAARPQPAGPRKTAPPLPAHCPIQGLCPAAAARTPRRPTACRIPIRAGQRRRTSREPRRPNSHVAAHWVGTRRIAHRLRRALPSAGEEPRYRKCSGACSGPGLPPRRLMAPLRSVLLMAP